VARTQYILGQVFTENDFFLEKVIEQEKEHMVTNSHKSNSAFVTAE
jgi:hypothetical protein